MKKQWCAILCLLLAIFLCACQAKENSGQESIGSSIPIEVDVETIKIGEHVEYGSYDLKEGDQISCDLEWSNSDGNLYIAVGEEFGAFDNGLISSGTGVGALQENIEIKQDGTYYIYIGSQNTDKSDIENVKGSINISQD